MRSFVFVLAACLMALPAGTAAAQREEPPAYTGLWAATPYPAQSVEAGESVDLPITLHNAGLPPQMVRVEMERLAEGWSATFLGDGRPVRSVFVAPDDEATVTLRLNPDESITSGAHEFLLSAKSQDGAFELPLEITIGESLPAKLTLEAKLPDLRGTASSNFEYTLTVDNPSARDVIARLEAEAPPGFQVSFKERFGSQELTSLPINAGEDRDLKVTVDPPKDAEAGRYEVLVRAIAEGSNASSLLGLEITGRPELRLTGLGDRLSGDAQAGEESGFDIVLSNRGSAPARGIEFSSFEPQGWKVTFDPKTLPGLGPGGEAKVKALITPASQAIAGDYQVTLRANGDGASDSAEFRITVRTPTLWGIAGVLVIAVALGVLTLAVMRYGRR